MRTDFDTYESGPECAKLAADRAVYDATFDTSFVAHVFGRSTLPPGPRFGAGPD
jgi:hypothetical protein